MLVAPLDYKKVKRTRKRAPCAHNAVITLFRFYHEFECGERKNARTKFEEIFRIIDINYDLDVAKVGKRRM